MLIEYKGKRPVVGRNVFIAPTATVIGNVEIKDRASIWYGVVLRGDMDSITIGKNTNIQDNCTVHTDRGYSAAIGNNVSVGHNAVIHGCIIEDDCLIAINAVVLNGACIHKGSVVAAGSVVKEGQEIGPYHLATGVPASVKKVLTEESIQTIHRSVKNYLELAKEHIALRKERPHPDYNL